MNFPTRDSALQALQTIQNLHDWTARFLNERGHRPSSNSQAAAELGAFQHPESVMTAYSQGVILIEVAADQMMAFIKTTTEPVQTIAPWTCVRSMIEASALAAWLFDPNIDSRIRVQRSFAFRYEGLQQQVRFGRAAGNEEGTRRATARIDEVESKALALGFPKVENRKGNRIGIAQRMPSITDVIAEILDAEADYRLLSAMAHAHPWALNLLGFRKVEGVRTCLTEETAENATVQVLEKNLSPSGIVFLSAIVMDVFSKPISNKCQLFGWDTELLEATFHSASSSLGVSRVDYWR